MPTARLFRRVNLPASVPGALFLHSMPGRYEALSKWKTAMSRFQIQWLVCLAPLSEIQLKSPDYFNAIQTADLPCEQKIFETPDFGVSEDSNGFLKLAQQIAARLKSGEHILLHCAGGVGRTGTLAVCVLLALGVNQHRACEMIHETGSRPESEAQRKLIRYADKQFNSIKSDGVL